MRTISDKEQEAVLRLDGAKRFEHFIKQVVDAETAWGLWNDGWALMADDDGQQVFPLWPAREYAEKCRSGDWSSYEAKAIPLSELRDDLLARFEDENVVPSVFPTPSGNGPIISPEELRSALDEELAQYE